MVWSLGFVPMEVVVLHKIVASTDAEYAKLIDLVKERKWGLHVELPARRTVSVKELPPAAQQELQQKGFTVAVDHQFDMD